MTTPYSPTASPIDVLVMTAASLSSSTVTPQVFVLSLATRAFSEGISQSELLTFLKKHTGTHPGLSSLLSNRPALRRLLDRARAVVLNSSPQAAAENRISAARLTLGRILTPVRVGADGAPVLTPAKQIRARAALAVLCNEQLKSIDSDKGWNTVMISHSFLGLRMGVTRQTARAAMIDLVALDWVQPVGVTRADSAGRFKISWYLTPAQKRVTARVKDEQGQVIFPGQYEAIGTLAGWDGEPTESDRLTALLTRAVVHPAWTYGNGTAPLSFKSWLLALASAAGVDPVQLGLPARSIAPARKVLTKAGLDLLNPATQGDATLAESDLSDRLNAALDACAESTGAYEAAAAAKAEYEANAEARKEELRRVRQVRDEARPALDAIFGPVEWYPSEATAVKSETAREAAQAKLEWWLAEASKVIARDPLTEERRKALKFELTRRLKLRGFKGDAISLMVDRVMSHAQPLLGTDEAIPLATEAPAAKSEWMGAAMATMAEKELAEADRAAFAKELFSRLRRRGYEVSKARQVVDLILPGKEDVTLAA
ncbi:hypothetical protein [Arthrobacter sp. 2MCAF14]|uniref:hypothetical protein n=1 Tax=Arthrobacter sp. 2MCAF14 TaxID=3232982 RepID=UPI003F9041AC